MGDNVGGEKGKSKKQQEDSGDGAGEKEYINVDLDLLIRYVLNNLLTLGGHEEPFPGMAKDIWGDSIYVPENNHNDIINFAAYSMGEDFASVVRDVPILFLRGNTRGFSLPGFLDYGYLANYDREGKIYWTVQFLVSGMVFSSFNFVKMMTDSILYRPITTTLILTNISRMLIIGVVGINMHDTWQAGYNPEYYGDPNDPLSEIGYIGYVMHELMHQYDYKTDYYAAYNLVLVERKMENAEDSPYKYVLDSLTSLKDIPTYEGRGQFVGQWAADLYAWKNGYPVDETKLLKEALIIKASVKYSQGAEDVIKYFTSRGK